DEVVDVVEIDVRQIGPPPRHGPALEVLEGLQPELPHPRWLGLHEGDLLHDLFGKALLRLEHVMRRIVPTEPVALAQFLEMLFLGHCHRTNSLDSKDSLHRKPTQQIGFEIAGQGPDQPFSTGAPTNDPYSVQEPS